MSTPITTDERQVIRWAYTARDANGSLVNGVIAADTDATAARRLQAMGLAPVSITRRAGAERARRTRTRERHKSVKSKDLALLCRQFATMLGAGLPIISALNAIEEQTQHKELKKVIPLVRADLQTGMSFYTALRRYPHAFPMTMVGIIEAGEASGSLTKALLSLAEQYEKMAKLRSRVISALTYPIIVLCLATVLVTVMLLFVVPRFANTYAQLGAQLPLPTRILLSVSHLMTYIVPIGALSILGFVSWYRKSRTTRPVRAALDVLRFSVPILKGFFQRVEMARLSRTLATLLSSGLPMLQSLEIAASSTTSLRVSDAVEDVRDAVRDGRSMSSAMSSRPVFPPMMTHMVATGEETGSQSEMLLKAAEYYEREVDALSESLSSALEPFLMIGMGAMVGGIVLSLYLPTLQVFQAATQNL